MALVNLSLLTSQYMTCPLCPLTLGMSLLTYHTWNITFNQSILISHFWPAILDLSLLNCYSWSVTLDLLLLLLLTFHSWPFTLETLLLTWYVIHVPFDLSLLTFLPSVIYILPIWNFLINYLMSVAICRGAFPPKKRLSITFFVFSYVEAQYTW